MDELLNNNILDISKEHVDYNGPIASSPTSPFVENTGADSVPEAMLIHGEEKMSDNILDGSNDSFLQCQDAVETPKEQSSKNQFNSQAGIFLAAISNCLRVIQKLNNLLSAERRSNISLTSENASLKIDIIKLKDGNSRAISSYHFATTTTENVGNHLNENAATESLTNKSETKETTKPIEDTNNKDAKAAADKITSQ